MHIAIDIRSLLDEQQTGVGKCTSGIVKTLLENRGTHTYSFYYNAARSQIIPSYIPKDDLVCTHIPNKVMTTCSAYIQRPYIDDIVTRQKGTIDLFFSPNIQHAPLRHTQRILMIHDLSFVHFPEYFSLKGRLWHKLQRIEKQMFEAAAIVVPSESTKEDVIHSFRISREKVHVVYPGIDAAYARVVSDQEIQDVRKTYQLPEKFILFLGTIEPRKNIITLIDAYKRSGLVQRGIELILAGATGWKDAAIYDAIAKCEGVRYIGYVKESEKAPLYALAQTFVYPSLYEGFGFPVLEAMAQGTPVITSNRTSLMEITNGQAIYVHPHRIDELARALGELPTSKRNKEQVTKYNWKKTAHQLHTIFETYGHSV